MCSSRIVPCLRYLVFLQHLQHSLLELLLLCVFSLGHIIGSPSLSTAQPSVMVRGSSYDPGDNETTSSSGYWMRA